MKSIKKSILLTSVYQLVYVLTPLITTPYISRVLGPKGVGDYSFAYSVAFYFTMFIRLGVLSYGNRTIAAVRDDKEKLSKTFCEIYMLQLVCGGIFSILYTLWTFLFAPETDLSLCLLLFVLSAVVDITWLLYGMEDFAVTTIRDFAVRIITIVCIFTFVKTTNDLRNYTLIQSVGYFTGQLLAWLRIRKHVSFCMPKRTGVLMHLRPDIVLFIPSIAVSIYKTMDKIMLGAMTSSSELGYYESSEKVINLPMAVINALGIVMLPRMSNMIAKDVAKEKIQDVLNKSFIFVTFVSTLLCFGMMSVANQFVPIFYGEGFEKCVELYAWLLPSCIFLAFANVLRTQYLLPQNRDKQFIISLFVGAGVNLLLNYFMIPHWASVGAAIATLAAEGSVCIVQMVYTWKELNLKLVVFKVLPFVLAGYGIYVILGDRVVSICGSISSLGVKVFECGLGYFLILGVLLTVKSVYHNREKRNPV